MPPTPSLAERIRNGECVHGIFVFSPDPTHSEIAGLAGFEFVIVDLEHAALDIRDVSNHVRAANAAGITALVRTADDSPASVARLLDTGVGGIVFPHVGLFPQRTSAATSAMRYAPMGDRPACTGVTAASYGLRPFDDYVKRSNSDALSIGLIEDASVVERLDKVLSSVRLDIVMPGPGDLAASLGLPGQLTHPRVLAEVDRIVDTVRQSDNCTLGAYATSVEDAVAWRRRGASFIAYSIDYRIFGAALRDIRTAMEDGN